MGAGASGQQWGRSNGPGGLHQKSTLEVVGFQRRERRCGKKGPLPGGQGRRRVLYAETYSARKRNELLPIHKATCLDGKRTALRGKGQSPRVALAEPSPEDAAETGIRSVAVGTGESGGRTVTVKDPKGWLCADRTVLRLVGDGSYQTHARDGMMENHARCTNAGAWFWYRSVMMRAAGMRGS